jgi:hypothetical protein
MGITPLQNAIRTNQPDAIAFLRNKIGTTAPPSVGSASDSSFAFASMSNPFASAALKLDSKPDVIEAAKSGNIKVVKDQVVADAGCVLEADWRYVCQLLARAAAALDL